jgi:hypothetical protein
VRATALVLAAAGIVAVSATAAIGGTQASTDWTIMATSVGGAHLGQPKSYYAPLFGPAYKMEFLENGYSRMTFTKRRVYVYYHKGTAGAIAIVTWHKKYRTPEHVGPCSPSDALATYPTAKKVYSSGAPSGNTAIVYRLKKLLFEVQKKHIVAVTLGPTRRAVFLTTTAPACS